MVYLNGHCFTHFKYSFIKLICFISSFQRLWYIESLILWFNSDSLLLESVKRQVNMLLQDSWISRVNHFIQRLAFLVRLNLHSIFKVFGHQDDSHNLVHIFQTIQLDIFRCHLAILLFAQHSLWKLLKALINTHSAICFLLLHLLCSVRLLLFQSVAILIRSSESDSIFLELALILRTLFCSIIIFKAQSRWLWILCSINR